MPATLTRSNLFFVPLWLALFFFPHGILKDELSVISFQLSVFPLKADQIDPIADDRRSDVPPRWLLTDH